MKQSVLQALELIREGNSVNWRQLKGQLIRLGIANSLIDNTFSATAFSEKVYEVSVKDTALFDEICDQLQPTDKSSRSEASKTGNTHSVKVKGALLIACTQEKSDTYNHVFHPERPSKVPVKKHALIIENLECFLAFEETYQFVLSKCGIDIPIDEIEFLWSAGNSITNSLIVPYLKQFEGQVMCLFDVDFGGIKIYANLLSNGLVKEKTPYLIPADLKERLSLSKRKISNKEIESLSSVYGVSSVTDDVIGAIRYYEATLEQESYRANE